MNNELTEVQMGLGFAEGREKNTERLQRSMKHSVPTLNVDVISPEVPLHQQHFHVVVHQPKAGAEEQQQPSN